MPRTSLLGVAAILAVLAIASTAAAQDQDPNPAVDEWVENDHVVRFENVPGGAEDEDGGPARVDVGAVIGIRQFTYQGDTYSADDFRDAYDRGAIGDDAVRHLEDETRDSFETTLEQAFPLTGSANSTPADLTEDSLGAGADGDDFGPPLVVQVSGGGVLDLSSLAGANASSDEVGLAFELGATFDVPIEFGVDPGHNVTATIHAPAGLAWTGDGDADVSGDGTRATVSAANWGGSNQLALDVPLGVTDPGERAYEEEDVSMDVVVDIHGIDLQLTRIPDSSLGEAQGNVTVRGDFAVIELPDEAPQALRDAGVTHVSAADARLLLEEGVVDRGFVEDQVENLTSTYVDDSPERVDVLVSGGLVEASLEPAEGAPNETAKPVRLHVTADVFADLSWETSGGSQASAVTIHRVDRSFTFPSLRGFATTYKVILPDGVDLRDVDAPGADPQLGTTDDGREFFTLDVAGGEEQEATVDAAVTESTVAHQAPELVLLLLLLVLLPILIVAALAFRGREDPEPTRVEEPPPEGTE